MNLDVFNILKQGITPTEVQFAFTGYDQGTVGLYEIITRFVLEEFHNMYSELF